MMKTHGLTLVILACYLVLAAGPLPGYAQDDPFAASEALESDLEEEFAWLKAETFVITASRVLEDIKKSAASITVITDKQIRQMGARHLVDVLQTIPGMSVNYSADGFYHIDSRGLSTAAGQHLLVMVNSHPVNENYNGGAIVLYAESLLDNVQRIEVIRGPGSALYGANAFAGIVNIITKGAEDIRGIQVSAQGGSFQTQQYNVLFGKRLGDFEVSGDLNFFSTDGYEARIEHDAVMTTEQTLQQMYGVPSNASRAPADVSSPKERYDAMLTLAYRNFKFEGRYMQRSMELPLSLLGAITERNENIGTHYYLALQYEEDPRENLRFTGKLYRNYTDDESDYQGLPAGMPLITPTGIQFASAEGLVAQPKRKDARTGGEFSIVYTPNDTNTLVAGATYEKMELYDVTYAANVLYTPIQNVLIPLPGVQDLTDQQNYCKDASRTFTAAFVEDLWDIRDNLRLTLGGRYDHYSDFGSSFNPRAGVTWQFAEGYDLKLLYGEAFRAPGFYELYSRNNPALLGNPDLDPETVQTYEISLGAAFTDDFTTRLTGFRNDYKDGIQLVQNTTTGTSDFQNAGDLLTQGVEAEVKYDFGKGIYLVGNYTFQETENQDTGDPLAGVPEHKGNLLANVRLSKFFNLSASLHFEGESARSASDPRDNADGFAVLNTTLLAKNFLEGFEVRASIYNLLDEEHSTQTRPEIPGDFPQAGRSFLVELRYELPL